MLRLVVEMKAELQNLGTNHPWLPQFLEHFDRLEIQLRGTATQQQKLFEQISQTMPKSVTLEQWREICRENLVAQRKLTTSDFHNAGGMDLDKNYVPLAIVERKSRKPQGMGQSEQREEERLNPIAEDSFFEEVLRQGQSEKSQGRRIAIIGEPGSGKTTRLQKIAFWILEEKLGLPIWVSLADLKNEQSIPDYIKNVWLEKAGKDIAIDDLTQHKERIWLLLDGLDEMTARIEGRHVEQLLTGWVDKARAIVTCRVNVWDADRNAFSGFDIFKNLPFEREQIEKFIRRWFGEDGNSK
ncbi:MAG: NACHT domain-containing protein [Oscillatoria sp. SIO1A7]|nr:NACHT domain-containing protein [Oscillatoria sp. SIO1A7]